MQLSPFTNSRKAKQYMLAYSAVLLIRGFSQLRFENGLQLYRKALGKNFQTYADLWSPGDIVRQLAAAPLRCEPSDIALIRNRLILCCRIFCLHRSIDLSWVLRTTCILDGTPFILIKRKGWHSYKLEKVISIPEFPDISSWHLIVKYVQLTQK